MIEMKSFTAPTFVDVFNSTHYNTSNTSSSSNETSSIVPQLIRISTLVGMIFIDMCALFGNLLVICAFFRTRRLQTVTNYFIASLAFADALVAIFVLPLGIYYYQRNHLWKLGLILCDLWVSSDVLLCTSSILNLTCISVDRYMAITRPLTYTAYRSKFLARVMILLVWIVSAVITCPPIFGWRDSNRRQTVEQGHKCDLNTARGYVVYSALGSFYIPAVIMIFVYIRIFMVVYDRENLIKKFHDKNQQSPTQINTKTHQNGLDKSRSLLDSSNKKLPANGVISSDSRSSCSCQCFLKYLRANRTSTTLHSSSFPNDCSTLGDKTDVTNCINPTHQESHPTFPSNTKKTNSNLLCRPFTLSTKRSLNLADEISHYRRNYLSGRGSEYRFRTGDSPCYERRTFLDSATPLTKIRSQSLEEISIGKGKDETLNYDGHQRPFSLKTAVTATRSQYEINPKRKNKNQDDAITDAKTVNILQRSNNKQAMQKAQLSFDISDDIVPSCTLETRKSEDLNHLNLFSKRSPTILTYSSSIIDQSYANGPSYATCHEQSSSLGDPTRAHQRTKPQSKFSSNSSPSRILIQNFKQQYKLGPMNASIRSNISSTSIRRLNETASTFVTSRSRTSKICSRCCFCCLRPTTASPETKHNTIYNYTPNMSLTYDDDDEEKISSNDISNRLPTMGISSYSLRCLETTNALPSNSTNLLAHHPLSNASSSHSSHDAHRRERIRFLKEQKTAKTLAIVVGGFVLFWLPFFIMYVIPPETYLFSPQTAALITWLGYCNSAINPLIYAYCSKQFRMAFWSITFGLFVKNKNSHSQVSMKKKQIYHRHPKTSVH